MTKTIIYFAVAILFVSGNAFCQMADSYRAAAQAYNNAAARCQNPAGAACMRQFAQHEMCMADKLGNLGSQYCQAPSCSTSCSNGGGGSGSAISSAGQPPAAQIAQGIGAIQQLIAGRNAAREARHAAEQSRQDQNDTQPQDNSIAEAEAAVAAAEAQRQKINSDAAGLLNQSNSVMTAMNGPAGSTTNSNATAAVTSLLDTSSLSSTDTIGSLLNDSTGAPDATASVASLLATPDKSVTPPMGTPSLQLPPGIPTVAALDQQENDQAKSLGADWQTGVDGLKDKAVDWVKDKVMDKAFEQMGEVDPLEKGINVSLKDVTSGSALPDFTLGSVVKDKLIDTASDKAADAISDAKDNLACSGSHTAVDHWGCMVFMTPSNLGRGLYAEGKLLVARFDRLLGAANAAMDPTAGP